MTTDRRSYWDSPGLKRLSLLPCDGLHSITPTAQPCGVVSPLQVALESHTTALGHSAARFATSRIVCSWTFLDTPHDNLDNFHTAVDTWYWAVGADSLGFVIKSVVTTHA